MNVKPIIARDFVNEVVPFIEKAKIVLTLLFLTGGGI